MATPTIAIHHTTPTSPNPEFPSSSEMIAVDYAVQPLGGFTPELSSSADGTMDSARWYCLRSRQKREHIAAAHLRMLDGVSVYCPRLRIQRMTRKGPAWFTEALFPGYLFGRFDRTERGKAVIYAPGIGGIVHFGKEPAIVPDGVIAELCALVAGGVVHTIPAPEIQPGDTVVITRGVFRGLKTLVTQALPASMRVSILLEILGDCRTVVVAKSDLLKETPHLLDRDQGGTEPGLRECQS